MSTSYMHLRQRVMDPKRKDDITDALMKATAMVKEGEPEPVPPGYMVPWYPDGLRDCTLGPSSRKLVPITRYYPTLNPKVAVDFEPVPPDKWYHDEKLKFCCERGVIYIPIALQDKLTEEQFIVRYKDARHMLDRAKADIEEQQLQIETIPKDGLQTTEQQLTDPGLQLAIQRLAIKRAEAERDKLGRPMLGIAKRMRIGAHTKQLQEDCRRRLRQMGGNNAMDAGKLARELEDENQRLSEGQVRPPSPDGPGAERDHP